MNKRNIILLLVLAVIVPALSGWGFMVHRTVAQLAIYQLPKPMQHFFFVHKDSIVSASPRPDQRRTQQPEEGSKHYMDMEAFGPDAFSEIPRDLDKAIAKYSLDTLNKYGTLPYVVESYTEKLTNAFRSGNEDSIVFYAAELTHYIADAHVPLHTSINYDGQLTGQNGIHDLWETTVPEAVITSYDLSSRHKAKYIRSVSDEIWKIVEHTFSLLPEMLAAEKEVSKKFTDSTKYRWEVRWGKNRRFYSQEFARQYSKVLKTSINDQLVASSNAISDFWYTAWVNAGKPDLDKLFANTYSGTNFKKERKAFKKNELMKKKLLIATKWMTKD